MFLRSCQFETYCEETKIECFITATTLDAAYLLSMTESRLVWQSWSVYWLDYLDLSLDQKLLD